MKKSKMETVDMLRNNLIDKLLSISNKEYLIALSQLVDNNNIHNDKVNLSKEQILMLQLSDNDIAAGRLISQEDLDKNDLKWLRER